MLALVALIILFVTIVVILPAVTSIRMLREPERDRPDLLGDGETAKGTDIAAAPENLLIRIRGTVELVGEPFEAPLTGWRCAAYELLGRRYEGEREVDVSDTSRAVDFIVRDATGKALLQGIRAQTISLGAISPVTSEHPDPTGRLTPAMAEFYRGSHGASHYAERSLIAGMTVIVVGVGHWEPDPDPDDVGVGYREAPRLLVMTRSAEHEIRVLAEGNATEPR